MYADIQSVADSESFLSADVVDRMEYFQAFLQEVLRYYPPVGMTMRFNTHAEQWDGHTIPAGTRLIIPYYLIHRHPEHWDTPNEFRPERWMQQDVSRPNDDNFAYLPFSAGSRSCIGKYFAQIEAQLIIANLVRAFHIRLAPSMDGVRLELTNSVSLKTKPMIQICVESR